MSLASTLLTRGLRGFCTAGAGGGVGFLESVTVLAVAGLAAGSDFGAGLATGAGLLVLTAVLAFDLSAKGFVADFFCAGEGVGFADLVGFTGLRFLAVLTAGGGVERDADLAVAAGLADLADLAAGVDFAEATRAAGLAFLAGATRAAGLDGLADLG